jgi:hypothetical protein
MSPNDRTTGPVPGAAAVSVAAADVGCSMRVESRGVRLTADSVDGSAASTRLGSAPGAGAASVAGARAGLAGLARLDPAPLATMPASRASGPIAPPASVLRSGTARRGTRRRHRAPRVERLAGLDAGAARHRVGSTKGLAAERRGLMLAPLGHRKNVLRDRTPTLPIADMRHVVADVDDRAHHSGGGCTVGKQTPRPAPVASPMGHNRPPALPDTLANAFVPALAAGSSARLPCCRHMRRTLCPFSERLGQPLVVENRPNAIGTAAQAVVSNFAPRSSLSRGLANTREVPKLASPARIRRCCGTRVSGRGPRMVSSDVPGLPAL